MLLLLESKIFAQLTSMTFKFFITFYSWIFWQFIIIISSEFKEVISHYMCKDEQSYFTNGNFLTSICPVRKKLEYLFEYISPFSLKFQF